MATVQHQLSPGPSQSASGRQKQKTMTVGITAGAEDVKYQTKYKDLKRKVKDIETDNDKLHYKIMQAKRNIQRMKLERAILYERLAAVPPSPPAPAHHSLPGLASRDSRHGRHEAEGDYPRPPPSAPTGPRGPPIMETPSESNALRDQAYASRRDTSRAQHSHHRPAQSQDPGSRSSPRSHAPVPHEHAKPQSSSRARQQYQYPDTLPPMAPSMHQPSPPPETTRPSRRMDISELAGTHSDHRQSSVRSPEVLPSRQTSRSRYPDEYTERRDRVERDDWERDRGPVRESPSSVRAPYGDHRSTSRTREEPAYPSHESSARHHLYSSRAGSPSPTGGLPSDASRPESRSQQPYDRPYPLRTMAHDDRDDSRRGSVDSQPSRPFTFPSPQGPYPSSQSPYHPHPSRDWDEPRRSHEVPMEVDSGRGRRGGGYQESAGDRTPAGYSPHEARRYYESDRSPDAELPRGFRSGGPRSPEDEPGLSRMDN